MKAPMACEPGFDLGMFVGGVVVGDQVHCERRRHLPLEMIEKADKLLMPVARFALGDNRTIEYVEGRKQGRGTVPLVIVGYSFHVPQSHGRAG